MQKMKEKKKFTRNKVRISNAQIDDLDNWQDTEVINDKRARTKVASQNQFSSKQGMELVDGRIMQVSANYCCKVKMGDVVKRCFLGGRLKQISHSSKHLVAVGDYVKVHAGRIEEIAPRRNALMRFSDELFQKELIIAANIDQAIITASIVNPVLKPVLIDRYLCACYIMDIQPIICINKIDLVGDISVVKELCDFYKNFGVNLIYTSVNENYGLDELKSILIDKDSVFTGQSGTGKSTIINALQPGLNLRVASVSTANDKGRHTTTASRIIKWNFGGNLIDTPGIKTFNLHKNHRPLIPKIFPDFRINNYKCKFNNCTHTHESDCGIKIALEKGEISYDRYQSYLNIYESLE